MADEGQDENLETAPGAFGLPARGEVLFACATRLSNSAFQ